MRWSWPRLAFLGFLFVYGVVLLKATDDPGFLHNVDLPIHETGHLVFAPFGETTMFLGGSLFQILVPLLFAATFAWRRDRFGAAVCLWWVAQNCWDVAIYVADARAQALPLVGGGEHDWFNLLDHWNLLHRDLAIAQQVRAAGVVVFLVAMGLGLWGARTPAEPVR